MDVFFPGAVPIYYGTNLRLAFPATVDGRAVECRISAEALKDHFGARSVRESDLYEAFAAHRAEIESAARWMLQGTRSSCIVLRSGTLRFLMCS